MTELLQSDHHPDADQLSAFVDHALPEHERKQTLAHLAVCQECRTIVALSLPAVEAPPVPQPERTARRPWWTGWRLFAPTAVAFAATVFLIVSVERGRTGGGGINGPTQMAAARPQETPVPPAQPSSPLPQSSRASKSASKPAALGAVPSALAARSRTPNSVDAVSAQSPAAPLPQPPGRSELDQKLQAAPLPAAPPAPPAPQVQPEAKPSGQAATETATVAAANASVTEPQPVESQPAPAPVISSEAVGSLALTGASVARASRPLPSRLPILSVATHGFQVIAIDTANAVFLSNDGGKRWTPVPALWAGRAVKADLVSFGTAPMPAAPAAASGANASFARFSNSPALKSGSSLTGAVTDATGAVIVNATVTVTASATHLALTAKTDASGRYVVDGLDRGTYEVKVQAPGFSPRVLPTVTVAADKPSVANVSLAVAAATQTVTVEAAQNAIAPTTAKKSLAKAPSPAPTPVFEITTDDGTRWTSADGVTWKQK